jgi:hypothetical protein
MTSERANRLTGGHRWNETSIEDILVCIHDEPDHDYHTKLGRMVREVDTHLVPFGRYTATERVRRRS